MDVLADARALRHRRDHGLAEVLRMRAREADALDAVDRVAGAEQLAELRPEVRGEVAPPGVDVLAEQRDLLDAVARRAASTSATISPGRRLCSRPRTAGTMQYAHFELQPIETCTQAWKRALAVHRQVGGEVLVRAELPARHRVPAGGDPLAEVRDRARPEGDVDERVPLEDPLALRLRVAAADRDRRDRAARACARAAFPRYAASRVSGFSRIVHVLKTTTSASSGDAASPRPSDSSMPLIRSESWAFIWQPNVVTW